MQNLEKKRTELEIIAEMMEYTKQPRKRTHIMYRLNFSFEMLKRYLSKTIKLGLLMEVEGNPRKEFKRTQKGKKFLEAYTELNNI